MGLAERRAVERFKNDTFPLWKKRIDDATGFDTNVEVNWSTLAVDGWADQLEEFFPKVYFEPLVTALKDVGQDEMGQTALRESLQRIVIRNENDHHNYYGFSFDEGTLVLDHKPYTNIDDVKERSDAIQRILEEKL